MKSSNVQNPGNSPHFQKAPSHGNRLSSNPHTPGPMKCESADKQHRFIHPNQRGCIISHLFSSGWTALSQLFQCLVNIVCILQMLTSLKHTSNTTNKILRSARVNFKKKFKKKAPRIIQCSSEVPVKLCQEFNLAVSVRNVKQLFTVQSNAYTRTAVIHPVVQDSAFGPPAGPHSSPHTLFRNVISWSSDSHAGNASLSVSSTSNHHHKKRLRSSEASTKTDEQQLAIECAAHIVVRATNNLV